MVTPDAATETEAADLSKGWVAGDVERQARKRCAQQSQWDFSDLRALFVNCTLKRSPELSHTQGLVDISIEIMRRQGVAVDEVRAIDHDIATGVWPDMTEHGWAHDDWPRSSSG